MARHSLPNEIVLKDGTVLKHRISPIPGIGRSRSFILEYIKRNGGKYRQVSVMHRNLRGKLDLHGRPYRPSVWILTDIDLASIDTPTP